MSSPSFNDHASGQPNFLVQELIKIRDKLRAEFRALEIQVQSDDDSLKLQSPVQSGRVEKLITEVQTTEWLVKRLQRILEEKKKKEGMGENAGDVNNDDQKEDDDEKQERDRHGEEDRK